MLSYTGSQVLTLELFVSAIFLESIPGCLRGDGGRVCRRGIETEGESILSRTKIGLLKKAG